MTGVTVERRHWLVAIWMIRINILAKVFRSLETAVTVQAPAHGEWLRLINAIHFLDVSVTGFASHTFCKVALVIEVRVVRKLVDAYPLDCFPFRIGFLDFLNPRTFRIDD